MSDRKNLLKLDRINQNAQGSMDAFKALDEAGFAEGAIPAGGYLERAEPIVFIWRMWHRQDTLGEYRANPGRFFAQHPNHLWGSRATGVNQVWVGDITCLSMAGHGGTWWIRD